MKITTVLLCLFTFAAPSGFSQQRVPAPSPAAEGESKLARFNLDFAGGTPMQLIADIQKAMGRSLNAIVPAEHANRPLPALKMNGVNVAELFRALSVASQRREQRSTGHAWAIANVAYGFRTTETTLSDQSIWFFFAEGDDSPKASRFYLLTPYLESGLTVDDITTAIRTGWQMRGDKALPVLSFHKETKLLIGTGELAALSMIDDVLKALDPVKAKAAAPAPGKAGEERKTDR